MKWIVLILLAVIFIGWMAHRNAVQKQWAADRQESDYDSIDEEYGLTLTDPVERAKYDSQRKMANIRRVLLNQPGLSGHDRQLLEGDQ